MADPMNAAELKALQENVQKHIRGVVDAMALRKYAVQAALDAKVPDVVGTAAKIYAFITAPATDVVVRFEP